MKILMISITFILSSFNSFANWDELDCLSNVSKSKVGFSESKPLVETKTYKVDLHYHRDFGCRFEIQSKSSLRRYHLHENGKLVYVKMIKNKYNQETPAGSKSYFMLPKKSKLQLFIDPLTKDIKVKGVNDQEFFFNAKSGQIDENQTTDFKITHSNSNIMMINSTNKPLINYPYVSGSERSENSIDGSGTIEYKELKCSIKTSELFDFNYNCGYTTFGKRFDGSDDNMTNKCSAPKETIKSELRKEYGTFNSKDLNEVIYKKWSQEKLFQYLSAHTECSQLFRKYNSDHTVTKPSVISKKIKRIKTVKRVKRVKKFKPAQIHIEKVEVQKIVPDLAPLIIPKQELTPPNDKQQVSDAQPLKVQEIVEQKKLTQLPSEDTTKALDPLLNGCLEKLNGYFDSPQKQEELKEYLRIQGKISLHRIAWATMKMSESNTKNIEGSIIEMLEKRNPELHKSFVNKKLKTRNQRLLSVMNDLKLESEKFNTPSNIPYTIKYSDIKMMDLLVEAEKIHGRSGSKGVMDFTSIIKTSMAPRLKMKKDKTKHFEKIISILQKKGQKIEADLQSYLADSGCTKESQLLTCGRHEKSIDIGKILTESQEVIDQFYKAQFDKNKELNNNFKWKSRKAFWLHVR